MTGSAPSLRHDANFISSTELVRDRATRDKHLRYTGGKPTHVRSLYLVQVQSDWPRNMNSID